MGSNYCRWVWKPTKEQQELFEEWRNYTVQELVSCKKGIQTFKVPKLLEDLAGERMPLAKMGFQHINQFLYQMENYIELRKVDDRIYIFVRESSIPETMVHIREMVLGQKKDKKDFPLRRHGTYVPVNELLQRRPPGPSPQPLFTSTSKPSRSRGGRNGIGGRGGRSTDAGRRDGGMKFRYGAKASEIAKSVLASNKSTRASVTRVPRLDFSDIRDDDIHNRVYKPAVSAYRLRRPDKQLYLPPGLIDSDGEDKSEDEFDFYSGPSAPKPKPKVFDEAPAPAKIDKANENDITDGVKPRLPFLHKEFDRSSLSSMSIASNVASASSKSIQSEDGSRTSTCSKVKAPSIRYSSYPSINLSSTKPVNSIAGSLVNKPENSRSHKFDMVSQANSNQAPAVDVKLPRLLDSKYVPQTVGAEKIPSTGSGQGSSDNSSMKRVVVEIKKNRHSSASSISSYETVTGFPIAPTLPKPTTEAENSKIDSDKLEKEEIAIKPPYMRDFPFVQLIEFPAYFPSGPLPTLKKFLLDQGKYQEFLRML